MTDVLIIGGGISGCSLLYALSKYEGSFLLLEKENDVGVGTTKANSAIVHAGFDPPPGTWMAKLNPEGNRLIEKLCADLDILYKKTGSLVVAFDTAQRTTIEELYDRGLRNGVPSLRIVQQPELAKMEPNLSPDAVCALYAPTAAVVNPWELASAQAEVAVQNGAEVRLNTAVTAIRPSPEGFIVVTGKGEFTARFVVNAAGLAADKIAAMAGASAFQILPSRGQYYLLDTTQGYLARHVVFQCPTKSGKGVLVAPTVHGNLIVGPNAEQMPEVDLATTAEGLQFVKQSAQVSVPGIDFSANIRNFAGVRAAPDTSDFVIGESPNTPRFFNIAGMKSPGLTAAPAAALEVLRQLGEKGLLLHPRKDAVTTRRVLRFERLSPEEKDTLIQKNPLYGSIVCRCKHVTEGEIVDALRRPLAPASLDGIKRRCNPGMGRCQGGFCGPRVQAIIAREKGLRQQDVPLDREGMYIITGSTKAEKGGDEA